MKGEARFGRLGFETFEEPNMIKRKIATKIQTTTMKTTTRTKRKRNQ
jgi:hypothetical protein